MQDGSPNLCLILRAVSLVAGRILSWKDKGGLAGFSGFSGALASALCMSIRTLPLGIISSSCLMSETGKMEQLWVRQGPELHLGSLGGVC